MKGAIACVIEKDNKVLLLGSDVKQCPHYVLDSKHIIKDLKKEIKNDLGLRVKLGKLLHTHFEEDKTFFFLRVNDFKGSPKKGQWFDKETLENVENTHKLAIRLS